MAQTKFNDSIKIIQIYPFNNPVSSINTKSVVLAGMPYVTFSRFYKELMVISRHTSAPYNDRVVGIKADNKKEYYKNIVSLIKDLPEIPKVIEVHQDTTLATIVSKTFGEKVSVSLIRHGPALYRTFHERFKLIRIIYEKVFLSNLKFVFCISEYATNSFKKNYPKSAYKFVTVYNTYGHIKQELLNTEPIKENIITFVGKPLKFKGIFIFLNAVIKFLQQFNNWQGMIIGARFSNKSKYGKVIQNLNKAKKQGELNKFLVYENLNINDVFLKMQKSKIVVVPCIVAEPFCLVALEGHMAGCVMITSGRGALKEVSGDYAYYLDTLDVDTLLNTLKHIESNPKEAEEKAKLGQQRALEKFNPKILVTKLDNIRESLLNK